MSRITELSEIRVVTAQLKWAPPGECSAATIRSIADRLCVAYALDQQQAYRLPLSRVVALLREKLNADAPTANAGVTTAKAPKRKRGRPVDTDPKADQRVFDAWNTNQYKDFADLGREFHMGRKAAEDAVGRHRKRLKRMKPCD
jgi:hypothetical protein